MPLPDQVTSSDVARHYDELDAVYRVVWGDEMHHGYWRRGDESRAAAVAALDEEVLGALRRAGVTGRVVDVGCGNGGLSSQMADDLGCDVVGVTVSSIQAARAAERCGGSARIVCGDWLTVAGELGRFDAVVEVECLGHMPSTDAFFERVSDRLEAGGVVVMADYFLADGNGYREVVDRLCRHGRLGHMPTVGGVVAAASAVGLVVEESCDWSDHVAPTWSVMAERLVTRAWWSPSVWRVLARMRSVADLRLGAVTGMRSGYRSGALEYHLLVFRKIDDGHQITV